MKYRLMWWEDNGPQDSYFYGVYYDAETDKLEKADLGATAYAGGIGFTDEYLMPTIEVVNRTRELLAAKIFNIIRGAEHRDVIEPQNCERDDVMRLLVDHQMQVTEKEPCRKCEGFGFWINPRDAADKRPCFACYGTGEKTVKVESKSAFHKVSKRVKGADGKCVSELLPVGTKITVIDCKAFGTFYAKGYNHPNRENRSVTGRTIEGKIVRVPMKKLRLNREPMSDQELRERAERLSHNHQYGSLFGMKAWESDNWALKLYENQQQNNDGSANGTGSTDGIQRPELCL